MTIHATGTVLGTAMGGMGAVAGALAGAVGVALLLVAPGLLLARALFPGGVGAGDRAPGGGGSRGSAAALRSLLGPDPVATAILWLALGTANGILVAAALAGAHALTAANLGLGLVATAVGYGAAAWVRSTRTSPEARKGA